MFLFDGATVSSLINEDAEWISCPFYAEICRLKNVDFLGIIAYLFSVKMIDCVLQFIVAAWLSWRRNVLIHDCKVAVGEDLKEHAGAFLANYKEACGSVNSPIPPTKESLKWEPPPLSRFKLNVDTAIDKQRAELPWRELGLLLMVAWFLSELNKSVEPS
ncbi:hypothetical protein ACOSQ2_003430 [Xanthoceras sorbifolium]